MTPSDLFDRLKQQAAHAAELEREASIRQGVRKFLRLNLDRILDLKRVVGTWRALADLLANEGLKWGSGASVTGDQLRALVAEIKAAQRRAAKRWPQTRRVDAREGNQPPAGQEVAALRESRPLTGTPRDPRGLAALIDRPSEASGEAARNRWRKS